MLLSTLSIASRNSIILDDTFVEFLLLLKLLKRIYNKALLSSFLNRTTRSFKTTNCSNYKNLNCCDKSKDYTHIICIFCALSINNSLDLFNARASKILDLSITKSQFYKKIRQLFK